jgi:hypothetical protein
LLRPEILRLLQTALTKDSHLVTVSILDIFFVFSFDLFFQNILQTCLRTSRQKLFKTFSQIFLIDLLRIWPWNSGTANSLLVTMGAGVACGCWSQRTWPTGPTTSAGQLRRWQYQRRHAVGAADTCCDAAVKFLGQRRWAGGASLRDCDDSTVLQGTRFLPSLPHHLSL